MELADRLKLARANAGFDTAKDAAKRLGIPYGTYSGHESGTRGIKKEDIERYAKAFDVSVSWLAFGLDLQIGKFARTAKYIGHINSEGHFIEIDRGVSPDDLPQIPALPLRRTLQAVIEVKSHALRGLADDGWLLYADLDDEQLSEEKFGQPCLCYIDGDYPIIVGNLVRGSGDNLYTVERFALPSVRDVPVFAALTIMAVVPKPTSRKLKDFAADQAAEKPRRKGQLDLPRY